MPATIDKETRAWVKAILGARDPIHAFLERLLSNNERLRAFSDDYLPEEFSGKFDDSPPAILSRRFRSEVLGTRECDFRFERTCKPEPDGPEKITSIIEFKSENDPNAPLQLMQYASASWEEHGIGSVERKRELNPIACVILHTGRESWKESVSMNGIIKGNCTMGAYEWHILYHLIDMVSIPPNEHIRSNRNLSAAFYAISFALRRSGSFRECVRKSFALLEEGSDLETGLVLVIILLYGDVDPKTALEVLERVRPGRGWIIMRPIDQYYAEQLRPKFKAEGKIEGTVDNLLRLAQRKFQKVPEERVTQVRAATLEQLEIWMDRILDAESLDAMFGGDANGATVAELPTDRRRSKRKET